MNRNEKDDGIENIYDIDDKNVQNNTDLSKTANELHTEENKNQDEVEDADFKDIEINTSHDAPNPEVRARKLTFKQRIRRIFWCCCQEDDSP